MTKVENHRNTQIIRQIWLCISIQSDNGPSSSEYCDWEGGEEGGEWMEDMLISRGITSSSGGQARLEEVSSDFRYSSTTLLNDIHTNSDLISVSRSAVCSLHQLRDNLLDLQYNLILHILLFSTVETNRITSGNGAETFPTKWKYLKLYQQSWNENICVVYKTKLKENYREKSNHLFQ